MDLTNCLYRYALLYHDLLYGAYKRVLAIKEIKLYAHNTIKVGTTLNLYMTCLAIDKRVTP